MSDPKAEFGALITPALKVDKILAGIFNKTTNDKLGKLDGDEFMEAVIATGVRLMGAYKAANSSGQSIPQASQKVMGWIGAAEKQQESENVTGCKLPLKKGDITFNEIAGQAQVKSEMTKNYIYPIKFPNLFLTKTKGVLLYGPPGTGKCLAPEEKVIMFSGKMKMAKNIKPDDMLMGDNSKPRAVLSVCEGKDEMYKIIPSKGRSFVVNKPHILSLISDSGRKVNIPLNEYLRQSKKFKAKYKGYRVGVEWAGKIEFHVDPYRMGEWLGGDDEALLPEEKPASFGRIPQDYKISPKSVRRQILAGLIDFAGRMIRCDCFEINFDSNEELIEDILFLAHSLCIHAVRVGVNTIRLSGKNIIQIPSCRFINFMNGYSKGCDTDTFDFRIEPQGQGKYCGFSIDGNRKFLLQDFTVTHNTLLARAATAEIPGAVFFAPSPGDLKGKYEGETEKNIAKVFQCAYQKIQEKKSDGAKKYSAAVIFMDEFDSLAGARGDDAGMRRSVNALLQAMDGIKNTEGVSVIAATNYPWDIDDAVLRRFTSRVFVDLPDYEAREWLVRASLMENYSAPNIPFKKRRGLTRAMGRDGKYVWNTHAIQNLSNPKVASSDYCKTKTDAVVEGGWGGWGGKTIPGTEVADSFKESYIKDIVDQTGPTAKAAEILKQIKGGEPYDADSVSDADLEVRFGYSASDMTKMMGIAVQNASNKALSGGFRYVDVGDEKYVVATPLSHADVRFAILPGAIKVLQKKGIKDAFLQPQFYDRVLNFNLCQSDISNAIEEYPSTIRSSDYVRLLNYKYFNIMPEK